MCFLLDVEIVEAGNDMVSKYCICVCVFCEALAVVPRKVRAVEACGV